MNEFIPVPEDFSYDAEFVNADELRKGIDDAREVAEESRNIAIATVGENGAPRNTVIVSGFRKLGDLAIDVETNSGFWSLADARHAVNLAHNPQASLVIFSNTEDKGSLTIDCEANEEPFEEILERLFVFNAIRFSRGLVVPKHLDEFDSSQNPNPAKLFLLSNLKLSVPIRGYKAITPTHYRHTSNVQFPVAPSDIWSA